MVVRTSSPYYSDRPTSILQTTRGVTDGAVAHVWGAKPPIKFEAYQNT